MRQGLRFSFVGIVVIVTGTFVFYILSHVDSLPFNTYAEVLPRRVSIAELGGKLDETGGTPDAPPEVERAHVAGQTPPEVGNVRDAGRSKPGVVVWEASLVASEAGNGPGQINNNNDSDSDTSEKVHSAPQEADKTLAASSSLSSSGGRPRIFCMIFTTMDSWPDRGRAVRNTWAQRCDHFRFFYTHHEGRKELPEAEAIALKVPDGREHLTAKTMTALRWAFEKFGREVDWFFKADDDTFVVMENLRFVAAQFNASESHYVGGRSKDHIKHGYNGGGAGYLLSREAARVVLVEGRMQPTRCKTDGGVEDLDMGMCLETFKVYPIETRDSAGRLTFHPDHPYKIFAKQGDNARVYTYRLNDDHFGNPRGIRTMSPHTVSFHYVAPPFMYMYDFLLYRLVRHRENGEPGYAAPPYSRA